MILAPEIAAHLAASQPTPPGLDLAGRRRHVSHELDAHFTAFGLPGPPVGAVHDHRVPVDGSTVLVRVYEPAGQPAGRRPVHVQLHGGGWSLCSIDDLVSDATARHRAALGLLVLAVEYRLAPEHPYPAPLHDVLAVLDWVTRAADTLGADPTQISIGGGSAGATLALSAALSLGAGSLVGLLLEVPALDLTGTRAVAELARHRYPEDGAESLEALAAYLPDPADRRDPIASPYFAPDLAVLPPTALLTAQLDPLHAEAAEYTDRLAAAGVLVEHICYEGALHGSAILAGTWPTARRWHDDTLRLLRQVHHLPVPADGETRRLVGEH